MNNNDKSPTEDETAQTQTTASELILEVWESVPASKPPVRVVKPQETPKIKHPKPLEP